MEPVVFRLGSFEITGFGLMMLVGFAAGAWVIRRDLVRRGLDPGYAADVFIAAGIGGLAGAKLWFVVASGEIGSILERSGMVWWGGLIGGAAVVLAWGRWRGVPTRFTLELAAPALALAYALGRVGCFLVGDDYGVPSDLPWAVEFPRGLPPSTGWALSQVFRVDLPPGTGSDEVLAVHPTQLYETAAMLVVFALLLRLRGHGHGAGWLFGVYLVAAGAERFLVEIVRAKEDRIFGPVTVAQLTAIAAVVLGAWLMVRWRLPDASLDRRARKALG